MGKESNHTPIGRKKPGRKPFLNATNTPVIAQQLFGQDMTYKAVAEHHQCSVRMLKQHRKKLEACYVNSLPPLKRLSLRLSPSNAKKNP